MVMFDKCKDCGLPLYVKDGRPKCFYCGTEPTDEEAIISYEEVRVE